MPESSDIDATAEGTQSADTVQPPTAPETISLNLRGFDTEEHARDFGNLVATYVRELSRNIDLSTLDGITVASDYAQALLDLDRGYATSLKLSPSDRLAYVIAMTPAVVRDGKIKSHMVLNAGVLLPLEDSQSDMFKLALHTLAHECAHVEGTERFNAAFPGVLLQSKARNAHDDYRWQIIKACWDEYAVTLICAPFGRTAYRRLRGNVHPGPLRRRGRAPTVYSRPTGSIRTLSRSQRRSTAHTAI